VYSNNIINHRGHDIVKTVTLCGKSTLIGLSLIALIPMQSVLAVDSIGISSATSISSSDSDLTDIEQARVLRKIQLQNKSSTTTATNNNSNNSNQSRDSSIPQENDESYLNSLRKEQGKQQSMKKTKAQRAKDLCESLGRGC